MKKYYVILLCFFIQNIYSQDLIINEIVADNATGYTDVNGKTPDWIEIKNISTISINLSEYWLSDKAGKAYPWQLPNVMLAPGAYYLIPATAPENAVFQWETVVDKGNNWKYIIPASEPSTTWKINGFDDSSWGEGPSGFGFGDDDDATIVPNCSSVFIRKTFTIVDKSIIVDAFLHMNYDDGFIAYINGIEVARANITAANPTFDENALSHEAGMYEVFSIENIEEIIQNGINTISIQIHNSSPGSSDLSGIPILSVGYSQPKSPTNGVSSYISLASTNTEANFKINASDETVYLFHNTTIIDSIEINNLPTDVSIGRINNDIHTLRFFTNITPNSANSSIHYNPVTISKPLISIKGGIKTTAFYVSLYTNEVGARIYYTLNGTDPTELSTLYTESMRISNSANLKARIFKSGYVPSKVSTESYIFYTRPHVLPIVSITVKPEDFFDWNTGIYVLGPNAETENPNFGANFWQDWERPAHVEVFNPGGETAFALDLGVKIQGNWSRANPQKSLKFYARSEYGEKAIEYQIFKDKPIYEFQSFILRNSGNDFCNTQMRDGMIQSLCRNLHLDRMAYQPAIVYINGAYYGIQNFREKINKDFITSNHGLQAEDISIINNIGELVYGSATNFNILYDFIQNNDISVQANYERVKQDLDIENYIRYNVIEMFVVNEDWPGNNVKLWRENSAEGRWRYILYDLDFGFNPWNQDKQNVNMLEFALIDDPSIGWPNPQWSTLMLRKFTQNQEFNNLFMNYVADILNTTFLPDSINIFIDSLAALIHDEIPYHALKWDGWAEGMYSNIQLMKDFGNVRGNIMRGHFESHFNTGGSYMLTISTSDPNPGRIHLNSIDLCGFPWSGKYFNNVPITITAIPAPGYTFIRWEGDVSSTNPTIQITTAVQTNVHAVFSFNATTIPNVYITEVNYNSLPTQQSGDWIEIYNANNFIQDVSGWILKDQQEYNTYIIPNGVEILPFSYLVICADTIGFNGVYTYQGINKVGNFDFKLSKQQETIQIFTSTGFLVDRFSYSDELPWPKKSDGYGFSLELTNIFGNRLNPNIWRAPTYSGSPGQLNDLISLTSQREKVIINEINFNSHSNSETGDWIELYNSGTTSIDISEWVLRDKSNNIFIIPQGTTIDPDSYLVFVNDFEKFEIVYPLIPYIPMDLSLSSNGDAVQLYDQYEFLVDSMQYSIFNIISLGANGTGKTLSLISPELQNENFNNWALSKLGGTPGESNILSISIVNPEKNDPIYIYPNPCYNSIHVNSELPYSISIIDCRGITVIEKSNCTDPNFILESLSNGIYFVRIINEFQQITQKIEKK